MFKTRHILYCVLSSMYIGGLANGQNPACPLCNQNTVVKIVYGKPSMKALEKAKAGAIIIGGCIKKEEKIGCSFCHRHIEPYLDRVRQLLVEYPERNFKPEAIYLEDGDLRILEGWRCGDDLYTFVTRGRAKIEKRKGFQYRDIPLLTPVENDFRLYVEHKDEDSEIFEHLRKNLYTNLDTGLYIKDKLNMDKPDWDYIMAVLHFFASIPEKPFSGVIPRKCVVFGEVEEYLQRKKRVLSVQAGDHKRDDLPEERRQYQLTRKRFREVCDLEMVGEPPWRVLSIRNKKLQFDALAFQDPDERKTLIHDLRQFLKTEFNAECNRILIRLLAGECHSKQDLEMVGKELERYLGNPNCTEISDDFACPILLKACIYEPETAIRWTDMIARMLLDEDRITVRLKNVQETEKTSERKHIKQVIGNIFSRSYLSCWRTGNYDAAERWMSFCGDLHTKYLLASTKEHLALVKASKDYFAFVRNDSASALRRAVTAHEASGMEIILKTATDEFLRAEAGLHLGELLLEQGKSREAMVILRQWKPPLPYKGHAALDLSDLVNGMLSRWILLLTKNAIAMNDVSCLEGMAFGSYTSHWAGEARRLGMKYLQSHDRERYERGRAYLVRVQKFLSYIILDFETGLLEKSSKQDK